MGTEEPPMKNVKKFRSNEPYNMGMLLNQVVSIIWTKPRKEWTMLEYSILKSKILLVYIYIKTENNYGFEKISKSNQSVSRSEVSKKVFLKKTFPKILDEK